MENEKFVNHCIALRALSQRAFEKKKKDISEQRLIENVENGPAETQTPGQVVGVMGTHDGQD